jgi:hypothetical protein
LPFKIFSQRRRRRKHIHNELQRTSYKKIIIFPQAAVSSQKLKATPSRVRTADVINDQHFFKSVQTHTHTKSPQPTTTTVAPVLESRDRIQKAIDETEENGVLPEPELLIHCKRHIILTFAMWS